MTVSTDIRMPARCASALIASLLIAMIGAAGEPPADLVLLHGKIHTQDSGRSVVQALALRGNRIVAAGSDQAVSALRGPKTRTIDLAGHTVLPGIIDAHTHPAESAQDAGKCSLEDKSLTAAEITAKVAVCLKDNPGDPLAWFEVIQAVTAGLTLTRQDLDAMLHDRPMIVSGSDGHTAWVNSAALKAAHISAATKDPIGGRIEHDSTGKPTGTLRDAAAALALAAKPVASLGHEAALLDKAFNAMRATGITSVQDAAVDDHAMRIYKRLYDTHRLRMRVRGSFSLEHYHESAKAQIDRAIVFRTKWAIDPDFLRADAIKIFADGVIEYPSQTAALLEPYLDAAGRPTLNRGPTYYTQDTLNRIVGMADAAGFTVHIHAIGDRAVRSALDAFADSRQRHGQLDNRDQIAHLELVEPEDFPRFHQLGVIANFQLLWAQRDSYIQETLQYLGPQRSKYLYPAGSLKRAGGLIAGGSDWSVSSFDAFEAMEHAITRCEGRGKEPLLPGEAIALQDVVDAYTINAAFALKQERTTGSLEPGKRGDFIVLDRDIFVIDPFNLHETRVLATYLDGREVYSTDTMK